MNVDDTVIFIDEPDNPYTVQAKSEKFAVCTRPATLADCESFEYPDPPAGTVVYTLVDLENGVRGPDHWIFGKYDYSKRSGCEEAVTELDSGLCCISRRSSVEYRTI